MGPMRTVGIDLAADRATTAMVAVQWRADEAVVASAMPQCGDEQLLQALVNLDAEDRAGVDCPFGWPVQFVDAVLAHREGRPWPGRGQDSGRYRKDHLRYRVTDAVVADAIRPHRPLSASFERLGAAVARWAHLEDELAAHGRPVDRAGSGPVCEVYPKASRLRWGLPVDIRSMSVLLTAAPWLHCTAQDRDLLDRSEHAFDALLCALTARAVALGLTDLPGPDQIASARTEGWIHLPGARTLTQLPHAPV